MVGIVANIPFRTTLSHSERYHKSFHVVHMHDKTLKKLVEEGNSHSELMARNIVAKSRKCGVSNCEPGS